MSRERPLVIGLCRRKESLASFRIRAEQIGYQRQYVAAMRMAECKDAARMGGVSRVGRRLRLQTLCTSIEFLDQPYGGIGPTDVMILAGPGIARDFNLWRAGICQQPLQLLR